MEVFDPTMIYSNKLRNIQLAKNPFFHGRTKHIELHYHFVRERVLFGEINPVYVSTDRQTTNIFIKLLGLENLRPFSGVLGLLHLDVPNLRGRKDKERGQERSRSNRDAKLDEEFDFIISEEIEGGSVEEAESVNRGSNRREEPKSAEQGGDESNKGEKDKNKTWFDMV